MGYSVTSPPRIWQGRRLCSISPIHRTLCSRHSSVFLAEMRPEIERLSIAYGICFSGYNKLDTRVSIGGILAGCGEMRVVQQTRVRSVLCGLTSCGVMRER